MRTRYEHHFIRKFLRSGRTSFSFTIDGNTGDDETVKEGVDENETRAYSIDGMAGGRELH